MIEHTRTNWDRKNRSQRGKHLSSPPTRRVLSLSVPLSERPGKPLLSDLGTVSVVPTPTRLYSTGRGTSGGVGGHTSGRPCRGGGRYASRGRGRRRKGQARGRLCPTPVSHPRNGSGTRCKRTGDATGGRTVNEGPVDRRPFVTRATNWDDHDRRGRLCRVRVPAGGEGRTGHGPLSPPDRRTGLDRRSSEFHERGGGGEGDGAVSVRVGRLVGWEVPRVLRESQSPQRWRSGGPTVSGFDSSPSGLGLV